MDHKISQKEDSGICDIKIFFSFNYFSKELSKENRLNPRQFCKKLLVGKASLSKPPSPRQAGG